MLSSYSLFSSFWGCSFFFFGRRLAFRRASVMIHCNWPLVLRNSSAAQASIAFIVSASTRKMKLLVVFSAITSYTSLLSTLAIFHQTSLMVQRSCVHYGLG